MGITNYLCQVFQRKSQNIITTLDLVSDAKGNLQKLRQNGWNTFIGDVISFCVLNNIDMPDMSAHYKEGASVPQIPLFFEALHGGSLDFLFLLNGRKMNHL